MSAQTADERQHTATRYHRPLSSRPARFAALHRRVLGPIPIRIVSAVLVIARSFREVAEDLQAG